MSAAVLPAWAMKPTAGTRQGASQYRGAAAEMIIDGAREFIFLTWINADLDSST